MLADELDYVVGVETHRDEHVLAVLAAPAGAVIAKQAVAANAGGYRAALCFAEQHANGRRMWAVEGAGHYGAGWPASSLAAASRSARSAAHRATSAGCVAKTTRSTRPVRHARRLQARRSACRGPANGARRCGCCCLLVAVLSMSAERRSRSCAV